MRRPRAETEEGEGQGREQHKWGARGEEAREGRSEGREEQVEDTWSGEKLRNRDEGGTGARNQGRRDGVEGIATDGRA